MALIIDISETGLLLETAVPLAVGDLLQLELPEASAATAKVVWRLQLRAGCEFVGRIPKAALSAALLASSAPPVSEQPVGGSDRPATYDEESEAAISAVLIILCTVAFLALVIFLAAVVPIP
jgi:hypothetical protein